MLGEYSGNLSTASCYCLCNDNIAANLLSCIKKSKSSDDTLLIASILEMIAKNCPLVLRNYVGDIQEWAVGICAQINNSKSASSNSVLLKVCCTIVQNLCVGNCFCTENGNVDEGIGLSIKLFELATSINNASLAVALSEVFIFSYFIYILRLC